MTLNQFVQLCGVAVTVFCLWLIYAFILSEAWFGVGLAVFVAMAGVKVIFEPHVVTRKEIPGDKPDSP